MESPSPRHQPFNRDGGGAACHISCPFSLTLRLGESSERRELQSTAASGRLQSSDERGCRTDNNRFVRRTLRPRELIPYKVRMAPANVAVLHI